MTFLPHRVPLCLTVAFLAGASSCQAQGPVNLIPDSSFESPATCWFTTEGKASYYAAKEQVAQAPDGKCVLTIQGWENSGSKILSAPLALPTGEISATWKIRFQGPTADVRIELALFDEKGEQKLATLGTITPTGDGWREVTQNDIPVPVGTTRGRLGLLVSGPQEGARIEIDQVGLFAGKTSGRVANNADFEWFEAEDMANGTGWKSIKHFQYWYSDLPSGMSMLSGSDGAADANSATVSCTLKVKTVGPHRLWIRSLHFAPPNDGKFTVTLRRNGKTVATKEVAGDPASAENWQWVSLDADLQPGEVEVVFTRPPTSSSWVARKIDLVLLTNQLDYLPKVQDLRPKGYVRFTNTSSEADPYNIWIHVHRHQPPVYYVVPGVLNNAGLSGSYYVAADRKKWLGPGESSPWVDISQFLLPGGGRNNLIFLATRESHVSGLVQRGFKGTLEFSIGPEKRVVKSIYINQDKPRLLLTLPYDLDGQSSEIRTASDYVKSGEGVLDKIGTPAGRIAKHLDLSAILGLDIKLDDPAVVDGEINLLKRLGFNGTYSPLGSPAETVAFNQKHGLESHLGLWVDGFPYKNGCHNQPDVEQLEKIYQQQAKQYAPLMDRVERMKLSDEPSAAPYAHFVSCAFCQNKFRNDLKAQGLSLAELDAASWDEVTPVAPQDKDKKPVLFYYTGLFRLRTLADFTKLSLSIKQKYLPANARTYVNYAPPLSEQLTWTQRGNDLWMMQRGALEMGWTEDWPGYGATTQQISPIFAQLRAAGLPTNQELGGYMVGVAGGPLLQRLKYYEMAANGARHINVYAYGPHYSSMDSWSSLYGIYPSISRVQHELGVIDEALNGTVRQKTDIAILYNRTAGIWLDNTSTTEQDARYIHIALAHAGYDADFIDESDIAAGKLANYKVLYCNGIQIRRDAATPIASWVSSGGTLFGSAGTATRDEYNRPLTALDEVFGAQSQNLALKNDAGRPKYELRRLPVLDELTGPEGSTSPAVTFNQLGYAETLLPSPTAQVILRGKAGSAAGVFNRFGRGIAIRIAAVPGITYLNDAVRGRDYDIETYLPKKYRAQLRDFIAWPATLAKATRVAEANSPITEVTRYDGQTGIKKRAVLFIIDHNAEPNPNFKLTLPQSAAFTKAYSASGKPVTLKRVGQSLQVAVPLDITDAIVLE